MSTQTNYSRSGHALPKRNVVVALAFVLALTACGSNSSDSSAQTSSAPKALPLSSHVLGADTLKGFTAKGTPARQDLAAFAKAHDKTVAELEGIGLVAGSTQMFQPDKSQPGNALSIAEEFASAKAATAEADRLFAVNSKPDPGAKATALDVPGIPGVQAVEITGSREGHPFTGVEIVFTDGTVAHELFAIGVDPLVSTSTLVAAASKLFKDIEGHPLAS